MHLPLWTHCSSMYRSRGEGGYGAHVEVKGKAAGVISLSAPWVLMFKQKPSVWAASTSHTEPPHQPPFTHGHMSPLMMLTAVNLVHFSMKTDV